jgi:hypothetical protein
MAWQLIYTSAPRGLLSGQSGFCTVARSADLREALVQRLEQISSYHYLRVSAVGMVGGNPTISAFRSLDIRGSKYHALTRIHPCGLDFTARTNHVAHHLVFQPGELAELPSPAVILRGWGGWLNSWGGEPCLMEDVSAAELRDLKRPAFPAQAWLQMTGDAGRAAGLLESDYVRGCCLVCPPGVERRLLDMFAETLQLLDLTGQFPLRPWRHSFTTFLQAEDNALDFQWRGCQEGTPAYHQALQHSAPMVPLRSVRVPGNSLVKIARDSQKPPPAPETSVGRRAPAIERRENQTSKKAAPVFYETQPRSAPKTIQKHRFLSMNLWLDASAFWRLGIFVAVLLALLAVRLWMNRHRAGYEVVAPVAIATSPSVITSTARPAANSAQQNLDLAELDALWSDGPTYLVLTSNTTRFDLPISANARFQNLIRRFDSLNLLPSQIQLLFSSNRLDVSSETALPVNGRKEPRLASGGDSNIQCIFDYSAWLANNSEPLLVQVLSDTVPKAVSLRFAFSSTNDGDPFRIVAVNTNDPPSPLVMDRGFIQGGTMNPALVQRLGQVHPAGGERWRLEPFVKTKDGRATRYLYEGWPLDERPAPDSELDFAAVKRRLAQVEMPLKKNAAALRQQIVHWPRTGFDLAVGDALQSTNKHLASFGDFAMAEASAGRFLEYLNRLKKERSRALGLRDWPTFYDETETVTLADQFAHLYEMLAEKFPGSARDLSIDNTNYFYATWRNLVTMDIARREAQRADDEVRAAQERVDSVPHGWNGLNGLDGVAYVGLYIIGREQAGGGVEMIRFQ